MWAQRLWRTGQCREQDPLNKLANHSYQQLNICPKLNDYTFYQSYRLSITYLLEHWSIFKLLLCIQTSYKRIKGNKIFKGLFHINLCMSFPRSNWLKIYAFCIQSSGMKGVIYCKVQEPLIMDYMQKHILHNKKYIRTQVMEEKEE